MIERISYKRIWSIAYPIILGSLAQNIISITDTAFLARVGEVELGAAAIGGVFYLIFSMIGAGFGVGTQIMIARRMGELKHDRVGNILHHAFFFLLFMGGLILLFFPLYGRDLLLLFIKSPNISLASDQYLGVRIWGISFAFITHVFNAFYVGTARTRIISVTTAIMATVNIILDYALIFGKLGLPLMGIRGAALASVIAEVSGVIVFLFFIFYRQSNVQFRLFQWDGFSFKMLNRLLKISLPVMFQYFMSFSVWMAFFLMVEHLGERPLAVSNIVRSMYLILMLPVWGYASATSSLVSYSIGRGHRHDVLPLAWRISWLSGCSVAVLAAAAFFFSHLLLRLYTSDLGLIQASIASVRVSAVAAIGMAIGQIFFHAVSGTGKTNVSFFIELIVLVFYLTYTYATAIIWQLQVEWVWGAEVVYVIILSLLAYAYLKSGRWLAYEV